MALGYAWFDSYDSVGYVLTLHIFPLGDRVCSREDVTNGLNIFRFFFSNPFVTFFAEIISKYQRSKFYMYLAQRCSSFFSYESQLIN